MFKENDEGDGIGGDCEHVACGAPANGELLEGGSGKQGEGVPGGEREEMKIVRP